MSFADEVKAAVDMLGGSEADPVVDFIVDPGRACQALDATPEHGGVVVRAAPGTGKGAPGFGPEPVAPVWIRVMRGAREVGTATLRGTDGMVRRAERVEIEEREEPCCDAAGCERRRAASAAWVVLEPIAEPGAPARLLVAEQQRIVAEASPADAADPDAVRSAAVRLATALGVPLLQGGQESTASLGEPPSPLDEGIGAAEIGRFALRSEGGLRVLRDWDSVGPRATAERNAWIGGALLLGAVVAWAGLWRAIGGNPLPGGAIAAGVAAALLTLAGVAFAGVARFSARYRAPCAALVAVGNDRIVVLPWVARDGAVDLRPEGRLGAAISLGEVQGASPSPRSAGVAVELATDHGPIDAMVCPDAKSAGLWAAVLGRVLDEARHPRVGGTARQRARRRAAATL